MSRSSAVHKTTAPALHSLAERLRDGSLKCLAGLQSQAETLAERQPTSDAELLEHLQALVTLAHCSMARFHEFTAELRALVDHVATEAAGDATDRH